MLHTKPHSDPLPTHIEQMLDVMGVVIRKVHTEPTPKLNREPRVIILDENGEPNF